MQLKHAAALRSVALTVQSIFYPGRISNRRGLHGLIYLWIEEFMKSLIDLWRVLADELASWCYTSADLDCKKLEVRTEKESVSFLTITLPNFCKDFERSLDQKFVDSTAFPGFTRKRGPLPLFLGGFLELIFDSSSGALLDDPSVDAIFAVRQLCRLYSKILLPCSDERVEEAMKRYVECENELATVDESIPREAREGFERISQLVFGDVLSEMDRKVWLGDVMPKHGPGATADGLRGNAKFDQRKWNSRLQALFPFEEYAWITSLSLIGEDYEVPFELVEPDAEDPVRVISVPKTLKTPRIIAIEPTCMQYMQQAMLNPLVNGLESQVIVPNKGQNLAFGFLGFTHQEPNRYLAQRGSREGGLATLDLSEASDRVLNSHVLSLLHRYPHFSEAVQATRSRTASVPIRGGLKKISLVKFASMGSALCFPMEAMVFLTVVLYGIEQKLRTPLTRRTVMSLRGKVRVYGDDIICPVDCVDDVIAALDLFGFKVNRDKSFWTGQFRESCGGEYYDGFDVTPIKFRRVFPTSHHDASEVIALVEFRNACYLRGLWQTTRYLDKRIREVLKYFPIVESTSPGIGRLSFLSYKEERFDAHHHRPLVKAYVNASRPPPSSVSGEGALLKCLLGDRREPFEDERHLERQGRPRAVSIKPRYVTPY